MPTLSLLWRYARFVGLAPYTICTGALNRAIATRLTELGHNGDPLTEARKWCGQHISRWSPR